MPPFMESEEFYFIYLFIAVQAFYLLGSVWFARFSFVKTTVLLVVLVVLGVYYIYYINERVFGFGSYRSEEHTSELQSLMRNSYDVYCLKKKNNNTLNMLIYYQ